MTLVAFIPARGGSKGIPFKNVKGIAGKPLIAWSIEHALKAKQVDRVIVSTDCEKIAEIARNYGAEVPFLRPSSISGDTASTESAMLHCCDYLEASGELPEYFMLLQATSPIRSSGLLDEAFLFMKENSFDSLVSVSKSHRFTWKNLKYPSASYDFKKRPRRQDITKNDQEYLETGSFYITKTTSLIKSENRLCGRIGLFETQEDESFEIDSLVDFVICEELLKFKFKEPV